MTRSSTRTTLSTLFSLFFSISFSQENPNGDPAEVKSAILNSNNITTIMYNYGSITRPNTGGNIYDLAWRGLGYGYEFAPLLAGEVIGANGDTLRFLDDGLWVFGQGDYSPAGLKWGWLPRAGYARSGQPNIATSNNPASWPASWTQWRGEFGDGVVIGLNEAYYVMDDYTNAEFPYYPFPNDSSKRGFGVSVEGRVYQFGGGLRDALIIKYKLKNESPRPLNKLYFGYYGDPHIGGPNSFNDDLMGFISVSDTARRFARNTIYSWDVDGIGDGGRRCGYLGIKLLQTPMNRGLTSFWALPWGNPNFPANDPFFYAFLSSDSISRNQQLFTTPGDNSLALGSGPFALAPGESTFVSLAIFLSEDSLDMIDDANYIHFAWRWPTISSNYNQQGGDQGYRISLTAPTGVVSGTVPVTWQYTGTDPNARVLVECSFDGGFSWKQVAWNHPVSQPLNWNTTNYRDGVNYSLRVVAHNDSLTRYYYDVIDQRFTVNNPVNGRPELRLTLGFEGTTVRNPPLNISWVAEDADNPNLTLRLAYAFNASGPFTEFHSDIFSSGPGSYLWNFSNAPNASAYFLRVTASDGNSDSILISQSFAIDQERGHYPPSAILHTAGNSTSEFTLQVVNPQQLTRHQYEMTFNVTHPDSAKQVSIRDLATGATVLSNYTFRPNISTPLFDGLKLTVIDKRTDVDTVRSGFNRSVLNSTTNFRYTLFFQQVRVPLDWYLAFNSLELLPTGKYRFPGDTVLNNQGRRVVVCPFYIRNIDSMQVGYGFVNGALADSMWRPGREFLLRPQPPTGAQMSYQANMNFTVTLQPTFGDTLWIYTQKAVTAQDVYRFTADSIFVTSAPTTNEVSEFKLFNNYPNPFNPTTTIRYQLPHSGKVTLRLYDILGREVRTLVDEVQSSGGYAVQLNAANLASGVYFYRLQAGEFVSAKKMMLIR